MSTARQIWNATWRVALGAFLLLWVFHLIFTREAAQYPGYDAAAWARLSWWTRTQTAWTHGPTHLWRTLTLVNPTALFVSILLMGVTLLLGVVRWRMVLRVQGLLLPWGRATEITLVAHFFNSFLLGSTGGDLMKAYYAARETHHRKPEAVVTVLVDRLIGLWAMLLFSALMMLPNFPLLFAHDQLRALSALVLLMLVGTSGVLLIAFRRGLSRRWPGAHQWLRRLPKGEWLERSLESCRQFGQEPFFLSRTLGVSMALNGVCVLQLLVLSRGLHLHISPIALFVIVPMIICVSAIPITPSGLGVRENLFVFMLGEPSLQVPASSALSLSLLAYAGSLFWSLVGGVVYATLKDRHHLHENELAAREESVPEARRS